MAAKNNSNLFFLCSLIEFIGRERHLERRKVVDYLGKDGMEHIYEYADVLHCEPIAKVADEFIREYSIGMGDFDNVGACRYQVPDYWTMGQVYERLIEDSSEEDRIVESAWEIYHSWIDEHLSDYNTDFYYQSRDYIAECYRRNEIL